MYITKSLGCTPETNTILYLHFNRNKVSKCKNQYTVMSCIPAYQPKKMVKNINLEFGRNSLAVQWLGPRALSGNSPGLIPS